ncbi:BglG family transcription antiterminator [Virgibacillus ainsalahensis]
MYISGREREVIELLLKRQEAIPVKEIARNIGASVRTIHRDLKSIEKIVADYKLELVKKTGAGVRIQGSEDDIRELERALTWKPVSEFTPQERSAVILSTLLETNEPIKLFTLASELHVTIATISHDLDLLEEDLAAYHLILIRRRGYGVKVEGEEKQKRSVISNLITKHVDPFEFVSLVKENIQKKSEQNTISNRLLGLVNPQRLEPIERRVEEARKELTYNLADSAYIGLVVHLALALERLQKGDIITFDQDYLQQMKGTKEYNIAKNIILHLENDLNMAIPEDETGYITMHLMGAKLRIDQNYDIEDSSMDTAYQAKELIQYISKELGIDLTQNNALLKDLVAHLKPAVYRLKQGMNIKNPMIQEIRKDYDELFHLIEEGAGATFVGIDFPEDEIGYLVLHFASALLNRENEADMQALVICSSGIGTAKILATKLKQRIPEIRHVDNKSLFDLDQMDTKKYDLIVSTIPLKNFDSDYIVASPMLTKAEVHLIQKAVRQRKLAYKPTKEKQKQTEFLPNLEAMKNYSTVILDLLNAFHIQAISDELPMKDILQAVCSELEKDRMIIHKENVFEKLEKREQLSGLGIPDTKLALYHTRSDDVVGPSFSIYDLSYPVELVGMDGEEMQVERILFMLAPAHTYQEVLEVLSILSSLIIQNQESMRLFETGDEAQIKHFLSEKFHAFIKEKI